MIKKARDKIGNRLRIAQELFCDEEIVEMMMKRVVSKRKAEGKPVPSDAVTNGVKVLQMLLFRDVPALLEEWPTPKPPDHARTTLQAIADAEPCVHQKYDGQTYEAPCDRCRELIALAREGLEHQ